MLVHIVGIRDIAGGTGRDGGESGKRGSGVTKGYVVRNNIRDPCAVV